MNKTQLCTLVVLVAWAGIARPRRADACSPPLPGVWARDTWPADGSTGVPGNALVHIVYETEALYPTTWTDVRLRPWGGEPVGTTVTATAVARDRLVVVVRPHEPLKPDLAYEVLDRVTVPCAEPACINVSPCDLCQNPEHAVVASFRTGAGEDRSPPAFAGLSSIVRGGDLVCDNDACCGPYHIVTFGLSWSAASDDGPPDSLRYHVYDAETDQRLAGYLRDTAAAGYHDCGSAMWAQIPGGVFHAPGRTFYVRAVDVAGNEEQNRVVVAEDVTCGDPSDGGGPADAGPGDDRSHGGCTIGSAAPSDPGLAVLAVLLLLRRLRRAPCARPSSRG